MAEQQIAELILRVKNLGDKEFKSFQDGLANTEARATKTKDTFAELKGEVTKLAATYFGAKAAFDLIADSLKAQAEQEDAINKLNLALANQGNFTKATSEALQDYAGQLQKTTAFSDDTVESAMAILASFGQNEEQIRRTTAVAADFAAATGTDLRTAVDLLGKAFAGHTETLARYGITIDETLSKSQRFDAVIEQLSQRFGGSAAAQAATYTGQLAMLKNSFGEAQEGLGKLLGEMTGGERPFQMLIDLTNSLAKFLSQDLVQALGEARGGFADMFGGIMDGYARLVGFIASNQNRGGLAGLSGQTLRSTLAIFGLGGGADPAAAAAEAARLAAAYHKVADELRAEGAAHAEAAGRILEVHNATRRATVAVEQNKEAIKKHEEQQREWARMIADIYVEALKEADEQEKQLAKDREEASKQAQESYEQLIKNGEEFMASLDRQLRKEQEIQRARLDALHELSGALANLGGVLGGVMGGFLAMGAAGVGVFVALQRHAEEANAEMTESQRRTVTLLNAVNAINTAAQILQGPGGARGAFGGAMAGAQAGAAFGPWGAVIGAGVGGILGLFGHGDDQRRKQEAQQAKRDAEQQMQELQRRHAEGVNTAVSGLEQRARGFAAMMQRAGEATVASQEAFNRLGRFAVATFAEIIRDGGDVISALQQIGPSLDILAEMMARFGFTAGDTFAHLMRLRDVVEANRDVADSISGLNQLMRGLAEAGIQTAELFNDFGADAAALFAELIGRGVDANTAMALMQPTLQALWEHQQRFHDITDAATLALLEQAEQQGVVGENMKDVNERILDVLVAIADVLGARIPEALRTAGAAAEEHLGRIRDRAREAADQVDRVGPPRGGPRGAEREVPGRAYGWISPGNVLPFIPRAAAGALTSGPQLFMAGEGGEPELIAPVRAVLREVGREAARAAAAAGGSGMPVVQVFIGGEQLVPVITRLQKGGYLK